MQAELLKLKNNPLGLVLLLLGPLCLTLVFALRDSSPVHIELAAGMRDLWAVPMHLVVVLFLPYLLTLEKQLDTEKWLWITPTRPWKILSQKWAFSICVGILFGVLGMLVIWGHFEAGVFFRQLIIALSTSITFTALSLALNSFAAVLTLSVAWSAASDFILLLFPRTWHHLLQAALPGMGLTDFASGEFQTVRILAHILLIALITFIVWRKMPRW